MCNFESLAELYSSNTIDVEKEYINLIINTFNICSNDKILDVGCGAGSIILPLSQTTPFTYGIDLSENMIKIAKKKDVEKKTQWLVGDILKYNFPIEFFNLIISFEAIHLLTDMNLFLKKIIPVLKTKGYLCMGFCIYNWETPMYKDIVKILNQNEIFVDNWFFQDSKAFENIILNHYGKIFSPVEEKKLK